MGERGIYIQWEQTMCCCWQGELLSISALPWLLLCGMSYPSPSTHMYTSTYENVYNCRHTQYTASACKCYLECCEWNLTVFSCFLLWTLKDITVALAVKYFKWDSWKACTELPITSLHIIVWSQAQTRRLCIEPLLRWSASGILQFI